MNDPNEFLKKPEFWFQAAVVMAALLLFGIFIGAMTTLFAGDVETMSARTDIFYKFSLIGAGLVTFCTVAWRGILATQQVDAQRQQIEKLTQQISATEENNLAALLQKGAEFLSDIEKPGQVSAGMATLHAVITDKNPKYAVEAMNLIADFLSANYPTYTEAITNGARQTLFAGAKLGRFSGRSLTLNAKGDAHVKWMPIFGVSSVTYRAGYLDLAQWQMIKSLTRVDLLDMPKESFFGVTMYKGVYDGDPDFSGCRFMETKIEQLTDRIWGIHTFEGCDFSGAYISRASMLNFDKSAQNYFAKGNPPRCPEPVQWEDIMMVAGTVADPL